MDFITTLAAYLALTYAIGAQGIPADTVVNEPTPTAVVVSTTLAPIDLPEDDTASDAEPSDAPQVVVPVEAVTATPAVTVGPTLQPESTITPNPSYRNLERGDKGERVVALQERLIELGYLTGEADGAFGNQTRRAVLRFQYYNGLAQDGVAGRATQTILFESDTVVPNPEEDVEPTSTPVPTATPVPNKPTQSPAPLLNRSSTTPVPTPTEEPEEITLPALEEIENSEVLLGSGDPLTVSDGTRVRVYRSEDGTRMLILNEIASAIEGWTLTERASGGTVLRAGDRVIVITAITDGWAASTDGKIIPSEQGDILGGMGIYAVNAAWLAEALNGTVDWDSAQAVMTLTLP